MASVTNLSRLAGSFFRFALAIDYPPAWEDALVSAVQWIVPMRQRGDTVPRIALYALQVVSEALGIQLPLTAPVVLCDARVL